MMRITFSVPLPPRGLRTNSRAHHTGYRARLAREYQEQVWCAAMADGESIESSDLGTRIGPVIGRWFRDPWEHARLRLTWHHAGVAPDADNALASLKALIDVLHTRSKRPLGIVVDDGPEHLMIERMELVKVAHRRDERVLVEVERIDG